MPKTNSDKERKGIEGAIAVIIAVLAAIFLLRKKIPVLLPDYFEIATVGRVGPRFSMAFPEWGQNLTYIEIGPIVGKYGRVFIAPPEAYDLSWSQLKENIVAGMYRELTPAELEEYWIE